MAVTDEIVEVAKRLIGFESIESRPDQLKAIIDFAEDYLKKNTKLHLKRFEVKGKHSLVGIFSLANKIPDLNPSDPGSRRMPTVFFHDHLDVVPGNPGQFKPYIKDGKLYGRGASDTKGNGAVLLVLAKELSSQIPDPALRQRRTGAAHSGSGILKVPDSRSSRLRESTDETPGVFPSGSLGPSTSSGQHLPDVGFMFTTDEEIGGHNGTKYLLEKGHRCKFFVTLEPTRLDVLVCHKGVIWIEVKVKGKTAHGAYLWNGENAALKAFEGLEKLYRLYPVPPADSWQTTINLGEIKGGDAFNKVIGECLLKLDIRYTEEDDPEKIIRDVKVCFRGSNVSLFQKEPMMKTPADDPFVLELAEATEKVTSREAKIRRSHGASDARFYSVAGIPSAQIGLIANGMHTDCEWLKTESLESLYKILIEFSNSIRDV